MMLMLLAANGDTASKSMQEAIIEAVRTAVAAASQRGWEAIVLVMVILGLICLTGIIVRWLIRSMDKRMEESKDRENRMAARIDDLEEFIRGRLVAMIDASAELATRSIDALNSLKEVLGQRPCLVDPERSDAIVTRIVNGVAERVSKKRGGP